jgi:streptogramin lyase
MPIPLVANTRPSALGVALLMLLAASLGCGDTPVSGDPERSAEDAAGGDDLGFDLGGGSTCVDGDRDGFGEGCAAGADCDDSNDAVYVGAEERCDRIDNDCDLEVDEGCPCVSGSLASCYTGPSGTAGIGRCQSGFQYCEDGEWGACQAELTPREEVCDAVDNDCDGAVDEALANACGTCGTLPAEVCADGLDNDCDGVIDETDAGCDCDERTEQPCYGGPPQTLGVGLCRGGTFDCVGGAWGVCEGQVVPAAEVCDGFDNDCDGLIDEDLTNACGQCGEPTPREVCDFNDNDCDGLVDEGLVLACGLCSADGLDEVCDNGLDDDCDGAVDEGCACAEGAACYPGPPATRGVGECSDGVRVCDASGEFSTGCEGVVLPRPEVCDGLDNDCDGFVDISPLGCNLCDRNIEVCDGLDNDCDGVADEYLRNACGQCIADVEAETVCNGLDDDCDGLVDEGLLNACGTCGESCYVEGWGSEEGNLEEGDSNGLDDDLSGGLRLGVESFRYPYIWVANSGSATVSRINTDDPSQPVQTLPVGASPSRTAVDLDGNVWVANRAFSAQGSVTKILADNEEGLPEVLFTRDIGEVNAVPRGLAIDQDNNAWVGTYNGQTLYQLRNEDGGVLFEHNVGVRSYGLAIDADGILWIASLLDPRGVLGRYNTRTRTLEEVYSVDSGCLRPYGIAVDGDGHVWLGNWDCENLTEFDPETERFTFRSSTAGSLSRTRGVAVDEAGRIWVVATATNRLGRYEPAANRWTTFDTCSEPMGVGITSDGEVWTPCWNADVAYFNGDGVRLGTARSGGANPYSYSDMTGFQLRTFTARLGTWTVNWDCERADCQLDAVEWASDEPTGTNVQVRARSSVDGATWSAWSGPHGSSPATVSDLPAGRYAQVEVTLRTTDREVSPVVDSVRVRWQRP